ncbi:hypothetical protein B296_00044315 [Ensete ventricosum]|uniref:Uncharacterized protein n=1 Tax=Ensete ventricosum TaxID=4639 RepID=A0A426X597_ENSVE|nr:hypothetical protein B296_00044315 [Ensete ventricosum]
MGNDHGGGDLASSEPNTPGIEVVSYHLVIRTYLGPGGESSTYRPSLRGAGNRFLASTATLGAASTGCSRWAEREVNGLRSRYRRSRCLMIRADGSTISDDDGRAP